jgi:predicted Rossmann-fold nucleotide-binding protein
VELADGFAVLPGSTGTLLELALVWELTNKRFLAERPIVCVTDYWRGVVKTIVGSGESDGRCIEFAASPEETVEKLKAKLG